MVQHHLNLESPEWKVILRNLHAFTRVHFKRLYRREINERGKSVEDYVSDAIETYLTGDDGYDPAKSPLEYYLKYNIIRRSLYNDLPPHAKRERKLNMQKSIDESNLIPMSGKQIEPSFEPVWLGTYDTELIFEEIGRRASGDQVVEQIVLAIWLGGFELSNRAEICDEYKLTVPDFDKGKKRLMTILGHVFNNLKIEN